jgi:hypothetical protein
VSQGDRIAAIIDLGGGYTQTEEVVATVGGVYVTVETGAIWMTITERLRKPQVEGQVGMDEIIDPAAPKVPNEGRAVREVRIRPERVIALIETPKQGRH